MPKLPYIPNWQSEDRSTKLYVGDVNAVLKKLEGIRVQCVVTSPPYWGLRDYGVQGQLGLEKTPEEYIENLTAVFGHIRRILRDDGTLWLNLGDTYCTVPHGPKGHNSSDRKLQQRESFGTQANRHKLDGLKHKDLVGIPWRVALALQADGWYLRSDIIWHKPNPMPESVRDRPTKSHEYLFLLTKSPRYFYDAEAVKEESVDPEYRTCGRVRPRAETYVVADPTRARTRASLHSQEGGRRSRNRRSVWTISTRPYRGAHFAVFPPALVEPCIKAGTSEYGCCQRCGAPWLRATERTRTPTRPGTTATKTRDPLRHVTETHTTGWQPQCTCGAPVVPCLVLDPFAGSGTTLAVANNLKRRSIGIELNPEYAGLVQRRVVDYKVKAQRRSGV